MHTFLIEEKHNLLGCAVLTLTVLPKINTGDMLLKMAVKPSQSRG